MRVTVIPNVETFPKGLEKAKKWELRKLAKESRLSSIGEIAQNTDKILGDLK